MGFFEKHLCACDHDAENGRLQRVWMGVGIVRLSLEGVVARGGVFLTLRQTCTLLPRIGSLWRPPLKSRKRR
jgi:hypothetical protein